MARLAKWKKEYRAELEAMSNAELFQEMLEAQEPDGYDGYFSSRQLWRSQESLRQVEKRLESWLKE